MAAPMPCRLSPVYEGEDHVHAYVGVRVCVHVCSHMGESTSDQLDLEDFPG